MNYFLVDIQPLSLQCLCRSVIRGIIRKNIEGELPQTTKKTPIRKGSRKRYSVRKLVVPLFESDSSDDELFRVVGVSLSIN